MHAGSNTCSCTWAWDNFWSSWCWRMPLLQLLSKDFYELRMYTQMLKHVLTINNPITFIFKWFEKFSCGTISKRLMVLLLTISGPKPLGIIFFETKSHIIISGICSYILYNWKSSKTELQLRHQNHLQHQPVLKAKAQQYLILSSSSSTSLPSPLSSVSWLKAPPVPEPLPATHAKAIARSVIY